MASRALLLHGDEGRGLPEPFYYMEVRAGASEAFLLSF